RLFFSLVKLFFIVYFYFFFFFQAEDGIRDRTVTGVQTCALPIFSDERRGYYTGWLQTSPTLGLVVALAIVVATKAYFGNDVFDEIGRASCRERVEISLVTESLKKIKEVMR